MRISDWSSDVCSSDLDISTLCLIIAKRRPGNGMIALSQPEEAARGQDDIGDLTGPLVEDELVDSAKFVAIAAMHSLPPHIVGRNQDAGRSEEHTSELQSLMRISYAVFCLKKKKQNTHNN